MLMNKSDTHDNDHTKSEMDSLSMFSNIVKYTQYSHLRKDTDIKAPDDKQSKKIFANFEKDINYGGHADKAKEDYQDVSNGI